MNARIKRGIALLLTAVMLLATAMQSFAAPLNYAKPSVVGTEPAKITGTWSTDASGKWHFSSKEGIVKDGWYYLNTTNKVTDYNWFYFTNGVMNTGWVQDKTDLSVWYYTGETKDSSEGGLVKGWLTDPHDGRKYYTDPSTGIMCYGWKQLNGIWYYFGEKQYSNATHPYGSLYANERTPDGYYVGMSGAWRQSTSTSSGGGSYTPPTPTPTPISVTSVSLNLIEFTLEVGGSHTLTATVLPANAADKAVNWSSDNTGVATVDSHGLVEAVSVGTATISVTTVDGNKKATCQLTVTAAPATNYTVTFDLNGIEGTAPDAQTIASGSKATKPTENLPTKENHTLQWFTSATSTSVSDMWDFDTDTVTGNMTLYAKWTRTLASILEANPDIPKSNNDSFSDDAWINTSKANYKAGIITKDSKIGFSIGNKEDNKRLTYYTDEVLIEAGSSYVLDYESLGYGILTFHMTNSKLTSVEYNGKGSSKGYDAINGTYKAPTPTVPVASVSLSKTTMTLSVGNTGTLTATIVPDDATNKNVTWSSSNESVATVSDGTVLAKAAGTATIIVETEDGNKTATCEVTVTDEPAPATTYTVTFDMQGHGTQVTSITNLASGSNITAPTPPTEEGWGFDGWFKEASCTNAWDFSKDTVTADTTLYAKWDIETILGVLSTVNGFPSADAQNIPPIDAWTDSDILYVYKYSTALLFKNINVENSLTWILTNVAVTTSDEGTTYTAQHSYGTITFNMDDGKLVSIEFAHEGEKKDDYDGTYVPQ